MSWIVFTQTWNDNVVYTTSENSGEKRYKKYQDFLNYLQPLCSIKTFVDIVPALKSFQTIYIDLENDNYEITSILKQEKVPVDFKTLRDYNEQFKVENQKTKEQLIQEKSNTFLENLYQRKKQNGFSNFDRRK